MGVNKARFANQIPTSLDVSLPAMVSLVKEYIKGNPKVRPDIALPIHPIYPHPVGSKQGPRVNWLGHSSLLLELDGKTLLLDPMFSRAPSPVPFVGTKRYSDKLPLEIEELPKVDAVLISHDHYDHLDYGSIMKLKNKANQFYVPLGVGSHLKRWGVEPSRIKELNWWDEVNFEGLTLACAPTRHFSGRSLWDRNATLWCSWVIAGQQASVYFSGDSGYGPHFAEVGKKYGPMDLTLLECGQYHERWSALHMMPEQTVQAHLDLQGKMLLPIHWCAFTLSLHDWNDPIERVSKAAKAREIKLATPRIGESVFIGSDDYPNSIWWK
ncbi:MAG TPA: MBL fold metallo-hydrolase [Bacillota bacterium]|nr:MBL fold metallo-hydrolase [Bacillota bacterium]